MDFSYFLETDAVFHSFSTHVCLSLTQFWVPSVIVTLPTGRIISKYVTIPKTKYHAWHIIGNQDVFDIWMYKCFKHYWYEFFLNYFFLELGNISIFLFFPVIPLVIYFNLYMPLIRLLEYNFWRRQCHPTPVLLPGKSHGRRNLVGCSPWGR